MNHSDPPSPQKTQQNSMAHIGWPAIQNALAGLTESPITRELCATLHPESGFESAQRLLEETSEMVSALAGVEPCPLRSFDDLTPILQQVEENLFVEPVSCLQAAHHLRLARDLKKYFKKQNEHHSSSKSAKPWTPYAIAERNRTVPGCRRRNQRERIAGTEAGGAQCRHGPAKSGNVSQENHG